MKEYICIDDVYKYLAEYNVPYNARISKMLCGDIPRVTKADMYREFAEKLKYDLNPYTGNYGLGFNYETMCKRMDEIISEMWQE